jgi:hypothetical protein
LPRSWRGAQSMIRPDTLLNIRPKKLVFPQRTSGTAHSLINLPGRRRFAPMAAPSMGSGQACPPKPPRLFTPSLPHEYARLTPESRALEKPTERFGKHGSKQAGTRGNSPEVKPWVARFLGPRGCSRWSMSLASSLCRSTNASNGTASWSRIGDAARLRLAASICFSECLG